MATVQVLVNRASQIANHEQIIFDHINTLIENSINKLLAKGGYRIEHLEELEDLKVILDIFSNDDVAEIINKDNLKCLDDLQKEIEKLEEIIKDDKELAPLLKSINKLLKTIIITKSFRLTETVEDKKQNDFVRQDRGRRGEEAVDENRASTLRPLNLEESLQYYTSTFIDAIENIFINTANYLNDDEFEVTFNRTVLKVIELCLKIPSLKALAVLTEEIAMYFGKRNIKEVATTVPSALIQDSAQNKSRSILIKGTYKIFAHYEYQFGLIPWKRYIQKLGTDSADRYLAYLLEKSKREKLTGDESKTIKSIDVIQGILDGKSPVNLNQFLRRGRTLYIGREKILSNEFFTNVGIRASLSNKIIYHIPKQFKFTLRYRLKFPWEILEDYDTVEYTDEYTYMYTKDKEKEQIEALCKHIDPEMEYNDPDDHGYDIL